LKIITWNVNSVRTRMERVAALLERHDPDVLCLQEIKVVDDDFPAADFEDLGYSSAIHGQKTYNGVAILSREGIDDVVRGFPGDPVPDEARLIAGTLPGAAIGETDGLRLVNLYVVNGQSVGSDKYRLKLAWLDALIRWISESHDPEAPLLLVGDFNIAPEERDVHDPERWRGQVLFSDPERERLRRMLDWGLQDLQRVHTEKGGLFTWWDYRMGAFHRGWGLRIDLGLGTAPVARHLTEVAIDRDERKPTSGEGKPSDHAPVIFTFGAA
jgi:exodeoxyribonuclease-3